MVLIMIYYYKIDNFVFGFKINENFMLSSMPLLLVSHNTSEKEL